MKTILVVYTDKKKLSKAEVGKYKKYAFNTKEDIKEGDILSSQSYDTNMLVVKTLKRSYKYYNRSTGKLSNTFNSTSQWEIREIKLLDKDEDIIFATLEN